VKRELFFRLLIEATLKFVKHLVAVKSLSRMQIEHDVKYFNGSRVALECVGLSSVPSASACATHSKFVRIFLESTVCVLNEEVIDDNRGPRTIRGSVRDESYMGSL
jgi:hypothetical protein